MSSRRRIGRYQLLELMGEGGMGEVWLASQLEPVRRKVALKIIKVGMNTEQVVARFESERQALAMLDHPNIAHFYDGGSTSAGLPYFVMELVRGRPITDYCDSHRLSVDRRVQLIVDVARALHHAHTRGLIHRDIKPSNLLVTVEHETPTVKVIDFGITKAVGQRLSERTVHTQVGEFVGTPEYMSPEQAGVGGIEVDVRTDIYGMGVVLYELLTGTRPSRIERAPGPGLGELRAPQKPQTPSDRLTSLDSKETIASLRDTTASALRIELEDGLDQIVMKAMATDRSDRYETALQLARDLERHGRGERVRAPPLSPQVARLKRHLAVVMFTDVEGYTALMQRDEDAAVALRERHRRAVEGAAAAHNGHLRQYFGDGSLSTFTSAVEAVAAAVRIQQEVRGAEALRLRIGLHLGEVAYDEQGVYGDAVNIAARIESLSAAGGILISGRVYADIKNHPTLEVVHVGTADLKNVADPVDLYSVEGEGLQIPTLDGAPAEAEPEGLSALGLAHLDRLVKRSAYRQRGRGGLPRELPLVGRDREVEDLRTLMREAGVGAGSTVIIRGDRGVGKSRLAEELAGVGRDSDWLVLLGSAHPAESLMPFAPFADAFMPVLMGLHEEDLNCLTGGGAVVLGHLFPALGPVEGLALRYTEPSDVRTRIYWHFSSLLAGLARQHPLLVILEDVHWADPSSVELLHFLARQTATEPIVFVCLYSDPDPERRKALHQLEQSLASMNACLPIDLGPLSRQDTEDLVTSVFEASGSEVEDFAGRLFQWTGGNPFFVERILRSLVQSGRLVCASGSWEGWDVQELELPHSVRDAILNRVALLAEESRRLIELLTILGPRTSYEVLAAVSELPDTALQEVLDDLARHQFVREAESGARLVYDFTHALIRETVESDLSLARRRTLHGLTGATLERLYRDRAEHHADELAYHFRNAHPGEVGTKAVQYLALAGGNALARFANREAMEYLQEALDRLDAAGVGLGGGGPGTESVGRVLSGLAKAKTRLGHRDASIKLWKRALATARAGGDLREIARVHRETGLALLWEDRLEEALEEYESALGVATEAGDELMVARINLAAGLCHQHAGRGQEALAAVDQALAIAKKTENLPMLARAQGSLVRLKIWSGDLSHVREHTEEMLRLAEAAGDPSVAFWSHWALAVAEGMFGNLAESARHINEAERIAREVGSPVLRLLSAEVAVEHCFCTGDWDRGIQVGEDAIGMARALDQRMLLPRLLVWTSLIYMARGEHERARDLTDEAWDVSGADRLARGELHLDVHTVVPAHIGRIAYLCSIGEWGEAIRVGEMGVGLADRSGYPVWGLHRLLPIIGEAHLRSRNLDRAREVAELMRSQSERLRHRAGLAWAEACEALLAWLEGDPDEAVRRLREAAESLDAIPMVWDSARVRRQLAGRLADIGDVERAREQLERVHAIFLRLGAAIELEKTRGMFEEIGVQPPPLEPG